MTPQQPRTGTARSVSICCVRSPTAVTTSLTDRACELIHDIGYLPRDDKLVIAICGFFLCGPRGVAKKINPNLSPIGDGFGSYWFVKEVKKMPIDILVQD